MEKRYLRKDGRILWGALTASLVRDEAGEPDYFVAVVQDVSARKQAEEERQHLLERSQAQTEELQAQSEELRVQRRGAPAPIRCRAHPACRAASRERAARRPERDRRAAALDP